MISVYYLPSSAITLHQTTDYFNNNKIEYETKAFVNLSLTEIKTFFKLSPNLESILNRNTIKNINWEIKISDLIKLVKDKPNLLKTPIIVDFEKKIIITGFNEDKLDVFLRKVINV